MRLFGIPVHRQQLILFTGDLGILLLALYLGHFLRFTNAGVSVSVREIVDGSTGASVFFVGIHLLLLYIFDAYNVQRRFQAVAGSSRLAVATTLAFVLQMATYFAFPAWRWGRGVTLISFIALTVLLVLWRLTHAALVARSEPTLNTLVVGAGDAGQAYVKVVNGHLSHQREQRIVGFLDPELERLDAPSLAPVLGSYGDLVSLASVHNIRRVVVAVPGNLPSELVNDLFTLKARGVSVVDMPTLYAQLTGRIPIRHIGDATLLFGNDFQVDEGSAGAVRRIADVVISATALSLLSPIILLSMLAVKLDSKGPALYHQERLGKGEQPFTIHKLRTMRTDAEAASGAVWSQGAGDPRVTRLGRFLRRSRLDELPQFWNVLVGEMSMVGPRPERDHFVQQLAQQIPYYRLRHSVKPGLTGWAQVSYGYGASVEDAVIKLEYELYAIQHMTPVLYVLIILKTVQTVLLRPGS